MSDTRYIELATELPRMGESVSKTFRNSILDVATKRNVFFEDLEWESHAETNFYSNDLAGREYLIHKHNIDKIEILNSQKKPFTITVEDFVDALKECLPSYFLGNKSVKIIANDDIKNELRELVAKGKLKKEQIISPRIKEKLQKQLEDPLAIDIEDSEVEGLADIKKKVIEAKEEQKKELEEDVKQSVDSSVLAKAIKKAK